MIALHRLVLLLSGFGAAVVGYHLHNVEVNVLSAALCALVGAVLAVNFAVFVMRWRIADSGCGSLLHMSSWLAACLTVLAADHLYTYYSPVGGCLLLDVAGLFLLHTLYIGSFRTVRLTENQLARMAGMPIVTEVAPASVAPCANCGDPVGVACCYVTDW